MSFVMMNIKSLAVVLSFFLVANSAPTEQGPCVNCGPVADRLTEETGNNMEEIDLKETSAEAIGDRIMEEMNGMKEKFDVALTRIGEEISKDQEEQDEMNMKNRK
eukprot:TRINITY_DN3323_c0_g1_i6.p1 TRINITY_DN3323_c0_g1~~TRINITY_DN3323_c0_g1_i6.p1  ORF type:complete len:105 (-),score=43.11 TRINITY_DN3323_c0_g1_i6:90-404(-)